jgi:hypothetical protein
MHHPVIIDVDAIDAEVTMQRCDSSASAVMPVPASQSIKSIETVTEVSMQRRESSTSAMVAVSTGQSQQTSGTWTNQPSLHNSITGLTPFSAGLSAMAPVPTNYTPETTVRGRAAAMASAGGSACPFGFTSGQKPVISVDEGRTEEERTVSFMNDDLFRAVGLNVLLRGIGLIFRLHHSKEEGTHGQEAAVIPWDRKGFSQGRTTWDLSFHPGTQIDWFVSHSWREAWWKRAISLMWIFHSLPAAMIACAAALVTVCFVYWQFPWTGEVWEDIESVLPRGFGIVAGMLTLFLCILFQGHILIPSTRRQTFFFDRCCIHQTDKAMKIRGIQGIGHFLRCSKGMVVLWDPTYFSRMWCMFELATFALVHAGTGVKDDTSGKIDMDRVVWEVEQRVRIVPMHFIVHRIISIIMLMLVCIVDCAAYHCGFSNKLVTIALFLAVHIATVLSISIHERALYKESRSQLETFDIRKANVTFESDREFVLEHVRNLWGDEEAFNQFVRTEFLNHVINSGALSCCSSLMALKPFRMHVLPGFTLCIGALAATVIAAPVAAYAVAVQLLY